MLGHGRDDVAADCRATHREDDDAPGAAEVGGQRAVAAQRPRRPGVPGQTGDQPPEAARVDAIAQDRVVEHVRPLSSGIAPPATPYPVRVPSTTL